MNRIEVEKKVKQVADLQSMIADEMISDIKDVLNERFGGTLDWYDWETQDDEVFSPTINYGTDGWEEEYHVDIMTCDENGNVYLTMENEEKLKIEDISFNDLYNIYYALDNLCEYIDNK